VERLLAGGAQVSEPCAATGETPLHGVAAVYLSPAHREVAQLLLARGADPGARLRDGGQTPLHLAARAGDAEMIRLLLDKGADPAAKDTAGRTPRDLAADRPALQQAVGWAPASLQQSVGPQPTAFPSDPAAALRQQAAPQPVGPQPTVQPADPAAELLRQTVPARPTTDNR
jgi:hypothetical protein